MTTSNEVRPLPCLPVPRGHRRPGPLRTRTPSWTPPWSPGCGPSGSRAWTSRWGTASSGPWSAPGRTRGTTAGTGRSTAAAFLGGHRERSVGLHHAGQTRQTRDGQDAGQAPAPAQSAPSHAGEGVGDGVPGGLTLGTGHPGRSLPGLRSLLPGQRTKSASGQQTPVPTNGPCHP